MDCTNSVPVQTAGAAIGGSAGRGIAAGSRLENPKRFVKSEAVARGAALPVGSDHGNLSEDFHRFGERVDSRGLYAVVVADEDSHAGPPDIK